jgi:hypothetical protein
VIGFLSRIASLRASLPATNSLPEVTCMAGRRSPVTDIRELLRRLQLGEPDRRIARDLGISRNTAARYRQWAQDQGLLQAALPAPAVLAVLLRPAAAARPAQEQSLVEPFRERVKALHDRLAVRDRPLGGQGGDPQHSRAQRGRALRLRAHQGAAVQGRPAGKPSPIPLANCPWCGERFAPASFALIPNDNEPRELRIVCTNFECDFTRDRALPIVAVDEPLYRRLPAFLIATVDKFAWLP